MAYIITLFLHILAASFWIGGMLFLPLVLLPGIKDKPDRVELLYKTGIKFRFYGLIALALLFITGFFNMYLRGMPFSVEFFRDSAYGQKISIKLLLFLLILGINAYHDRKALQAIQSGESQKFRGVARWSGRIVLLISLAMAFLGLMISRGM